MATTEATMSWTEDPMAIIGFDFDYLTVTETKMVNFLDEFSIMGSRKILELNRGDDSKINEYLRKFVIVDFQFRISYSPHHI